MYAFVDRSSADVEERWRKVQDVNLNGAFYVVQQAAKQMAKQEPRGGSIIAISSISALVGGEFQAHYTPTKGDARHYVYMTCSESNSSGIEELDGVLRCGSWTSRHQMQRGVARDYPNGNQC